MLPRLREECRALRCRKGEAVRGQGGPRLWALELDSIQDWPLPPLNLGPWEQWETRPLRSHRAPLGASLALRTLVLVAQPRAFGSALRLGEGRCARAQGGSVLRPLFPPMAPLLSFCSDL